MKTFITSATAFYTFAPGEPFSSDRLNTDINRMYVVWPEGEVWRVKYRFHRGWEEITVQRFDTENAAFCFAYDHFLNS